MDYSEFILKKGGLKAYDIQKISHDISNINNNNLDSEYNPTSTDSFVNELLSQNAPFRLDLRKIPDTIDWRTQNNVLNPVRNQGACGSCWAFSVVSVVESRYALKTNKLLKMSEQELLDCDTDEDGCDGGWPEDAFEWLQKHGPALEESCP